LFILSQALPMLASDVPSRQNNLAYANLLEPAAENSHAAPKYLSDPMRQAKAAGQSVFALGAAAAHRISRVLPWYLAKLQAQQRFSQPVIAGIAFLVFLPIVWFGLQTLSRESSASRDGIAVPSDGSGELKAEPAHGRRGTLHGMSVRPHAIQVLRKDASAKIFDQWLDEDEFFPRRYCVVPLLDGKPHGECRGYDEQGRLIVVEHHQRGHLHGQQTCYYPSGKKQRVMSFENGRPVGTVTTWFDGGSIAGTSKLAGGQFHGTCVAYFRKGSKFLEFEVAEGVPHGKRLHYRPDGRVFGVTTWENGRQVGEQLLLDVTPHDLKIIQEASRFSYTLKDHWGQRSGGQNRNNTATSPTPSNANREALRNALLQAESDYLQANAEYEANQAAYEKQRDFQMNNAGRLAASGVKLPALIPPDPQLLIRLERTKQAYREAKERFEQGR
jgi:hypothetical protein